MELIKNNADLGAKIAIELSLLKKVWKDINSIKPITIIGAFSLDILS